MERCAVLIAVTVAGIAACTSGGQGSRDGGALSDGAADGSTSACIAGTSIGCAGPLGCSGFQVCRDDGSGYGACDCAGVDAAIDAGAPVDATTDAAGTDADSLDAPAGDASRSDPCDGPDGGPPWSPWSMFGRCGSRAGRALQVAAQTNNVKWLLDVHQTMGWSSVIAPDGTLYFQSLDTALFAVTPAGAFKWSYATSGYAGPPAVASDGTVYVGDYKALVALNPDSSVRWSLAMPNPTLPTPTAPALGADGTVYVALYPTQTTSGHLLAVTPMGTQTWDFVTAPPYGTTVAPTVVDPLAALAPDGTLYVNSVTLPDGGTQYAGLLYAVHPDGTESWRFETPCAPAGPAIAPDGTIEFLCGPALYAIHPNGVQKWVCAVSPYSAALAIGADGTTYLRGDELYAIDANGTPTWTFSSGGAAFTGIPAVGGDGAIYVGGGSGFYAVSSDGTQKWLSTVQDHFSGQPSIGADGTVYAAGNNVYAFGP